MSEFLIVPLKKPSEVDIAVPLRNLIQSRYSTADKPEDYSDAIAEFSKQRHQAVWKVFEKFESSLEIIYSYYDQVVALESKVPAMELQIPFKWRDAFDKGSLFGGKMSLTIPSLGYEKVCVLFNIAALQSSVAAMQSLETDESLKLAAKLFQQSAGIFHYLKGTVMQTVLQDPTPDLNPDTLGALSQLMLAQAQEIFVHKAIHDKMKDTVVARLAAQCTDLYDEALKYSQRESLRHLWERDWSLAINVKKIVLEAVAHFYQSIVCRSEKRIGEQLSRLEYSVSGFKTAQQKFGKATVFEDVRRRAERNYAEAKKDNDFIYHERIPDVGTLEPIGKAAVAKLLPVQSPMSSRFKDLFADLMPVAVHQALTAYDLRRSEIENTEIGHLREATNTLNGFLASLNLPACIESVEALGSLPPSIIEKSQTVVQMGGIKELEKMLKELPDSLKRNQDILDETARMLREEKEADDSLRQQFRERWTRTPSDKLTDMFKTNLNKYRELIENAIKADAVVQNKFQTHRPAIELLSEGEAKIRTAAPQPSGQFTSSNEPGGAINELRELMREVQDLKSERTAIEESLKSSSNTAQFDAMKSEFMQALSKDGAISEPGISMELLGRHYGEYQRRIKQSLQRQDDIVARIQSAFEVFKGGRSGGANTNTWDTFLMQLASAHDAFRDLLNNMNEGTKFYNDLTQILLTFQNKVNDYCFARKTEKDELMKDLTQQSSRSSTTPAPSQPSYFSTATEPPKPTDPSTSATAPTIPNLPYPVQVQGMPIPYGQFVPMPGGYNPYATLPFPSHPHNFMPYGQPGYYPYPQQPGNYKPQN